MWAVQKGQYQVFCTTISSIRSPAQGATQWHTTTGTTAGATTLVVNIIDIATTSKFLRAPLIVAIIIIIVAIIIVAIIITSNIYNKHYYLSTTTVSIIIIARICIITHSHALDLPHTPRPTTTTRTLHHR
jgi:hypothetical protein